MEYNLVRMKKIIIISVLTIFLLIVFLSRYKYLSTAGGQIVRINRFTTKIVTYDVYLNREYHKVQSSGKQVDFSDFRVKTEKRPSEK